MASFRLITTTFLLSVALCAAQSLAPPVPMNAAAEAHLQANIPALMEKAGVPGLSIAVIRDGRTVWSESFGVRSETTTRNVDRHASFPK